MADHWKSIANLLGAPGVDEPEPENQETENEVDELANSASQGDSPILEETQPESPAESGLITSEEESRPIKLERETLEREREVEPTARETRASWGERRQAKSSEARSESVKSETAARSNPQPEVAAKPRRKSSWESLANMFNVKIDRAPPSLQEPAAEAELPLEVEDEPDRDAVASDSPLTIFDEEAAEEGNAALDAMFADAPRESSERKRSPRIVDDLSWGEEPASSDSSESQPESVDEDEVPRRGRRRRRRGRRGGGDAVEPVGRDATSRETAWEPSDVDASEADEEWQEPEDIVPRQEAIGVDLSEDAAQPELTDRRSSRRRRRGRGRDREARELEARELEVTDEFERPRSLDISSRGKEVDDKEEEKKETDELTPPSRSAATRRAEERSPARGRRRERSGESRKQTPELERAPAIEPEFDFDDTDDDTDDDSTKETTKHRNIPTWADSIQSLVEANIDNRRRNDNRGGPRGRPRGRR